MTNKEVKLARFLEALLIGWPMLAFGLNFMVWDLAYDSVLSQWSEVWKGKNEKNFVVYMGKIGMVLKKVLTKNQIERSSDFKEYDLISKPIISKLYIYEGKGVIVYVCVDKEGIVKDIVIRGVRD